MNNEIKEMMEQMESIVITGKDKNGIKVDGYGLQQNELKMFLDYITNLQQENEKLNKLKEYVNCRIEEFKNAGSSRKEIKAHQYYMLLCDIEKILNSSL